MKKIEIRSTPADKKTESLARKVLGLKTKRMPCDRNCEACDRFRC